VICNGNSTDDQARWLRCSDGTPRGCYECGCCIATQLVAGSGMCDPCATYKTAQWAEMDSLR
jgi:hypothetical protein